MPTYQITPISTPTKYCSLSLFKQYLLGTINDPNNPTIFNGAVAGTPDDNLLTDCILLAETTFDKEIGSGFDQQTYTLVSPIQTFVDGNGWLHLWARERGPVTNVSAVEVRDVFGGSTTWDAVTWDVNNDIIYPPSTTLDKYPYPESWKIRIWPATPLAPSASGQIFARWSYQGGFNPIPDALSLLIAEAALFIYKSREMPIGKVVNMPLGTMTVPSNFPPYILRQFRLWSPIY